MKSTHLLHTGPIGQYSSSETVYSCCKDCNQSKLNVKIVHALRWEITNLGSILEF